MKILVTGVAGAIGSHMAEKLLAEGHEVIGIDCLTPYYDPEIKKINLEDVLNKGAKFIKCDLAEDDYFEEIKDVEIIYHFAAQPGISAKTSFEDYLKNNIIATQKLLDTSRRINSLKLFVHISTSSVYGVRAQGNEETVPAPTSHYGVTKLASEQLALSYYREYGLPVVVLRMFSVYGERERPEKLFHKLTKAILEDTEFPLYEGSEEHKRSFTYVGDAVNACNLVLKNIDKVKGEIFNIGGGDVSTTGEGIKIIEGILGKKAKLKIVQKRQGDQLETKADIIKAERILGYAPKTDLESGLEREALWYKNHIWQKVK